jgi:hypothetical protein
VIYKTERELVRQQPRVRSIYLLIQL